MSEFLKLVLSGDGTSPSNNTDSTDHTDTATPGSHNSGRSQSSTEEDNVRHRQTSPQREYTQEQQEAIQKYEWAWLGYSM